MLTKVPTLSGRLTKSIVQFTALLLLFFAGLVIFLVYALEDATFTLHLKQAANDLANGNPISPHIQHLKDLNHYQISLPPLVDLNDHSFGEFRYLGSYFHYMQIDKGVLLMKADDLLYVSRGLKDILLLLALVFSPVLLLCIPLAKKLSSHALKPFDELCDLFVGEQKQHQDTNNVISNIAEQDVKAIASKLQEALDDKARLLQEQIVFNQGMSHEIRTPLQVMTHSLELLSATTPELSEKKSFKRLQKSAQRTQRISEALLWLTSEEKFQGLSNAEQAVKEILEQSVDLLKAHQLTVNLEVGDSLDFPMPEEVLELTISNLLTNAIQHAADTETGKSLEIAIRPNGISFTNGVDSGESDDTRGFGLGIQLVTKLAQRFGLVVQIEQKNQADKKFTINLSHPG